MVRLRGGGREEWWSGQARDGWRREWKKWREWRKEWSGQAGVAEGRKEGWKDTPKDSNDSSKSRRCPNAPCLKEFKSQEAGDIGDKLFQSIPVKGLKD